LRRIEVSSQEVMSQRKFARIPVANVQELVNRENPKPQGKINTIQGEKTMERIKNFFKDESGASAVEYGLLVGLIAVIIIGAVGTLGGKVRDAFQSAADTLP
jgi:pilus assembly protein Flp/PilA